MWIAKQLLRLLVIGNFMLLFLISCASQTRTMSPAPAGTTVAQPSSAQEVKIDLVGSAFAPKEVTVPVGTKVTWTMRDRGTTHTVTVASKTSEVAFDQKVETGETFSYTFNTPGVFHYVCIFHYGMEGTIIVGDGKQSDAPKQPAQSTPADPYYQSGY